MAKRPDDSVPFDDIELLNIHRYPESHPASLVAQVRNSKVCQKRLEELLKTLPGKGGKNRVLFDYTAPPVPSAVESPSAPQKGGLQSAWDAVRKALS